MGNFNYMPGQSIGANSSGGFSWRDDEDLSLTQGIGALWNNVSGATANNEFNAAEAEKARLFNSAEATRERAWQTEMSNTAYQRAAADMQAAGINPASLGGNATMSPASSGSGASASGVAAHSSSNNGNGFLNALISGMQMALKARIARSALSVKEGIAEQNNMNKSVIAAENRQSRENVAAANRNSRESIASNKLESEEGRFGDSLELKGLIASKNLLHKQDVLSAMKADRLAKNALRQQEIDDNREYRRYHGKNEALTYWQRMLFGKGRKG